MTQVTRQGIEIGHHGGVDTELIEHGDDMRSPSWSTALGGRVSQPIQAVRAVPHVGSWAGILVIAVGAILLFVAWVRVATLTNVGLQLPYLISAGLTGFALVAVGLTVVNVAVKREDARHRARQYGELRALIIELRMSLSADGRQEWLP